MHGGNGLTFCMLMYLDHLQNWLVQGQGLLIFVILALFWLIEMGQILGVSGHFLENAWREWPDIWYAAVSWPPSDLIRLWLRSGDFSNFGAILISWNGSNLGFPDIFWKTHWGNSLKFRDLALLQVIWRIGSRWHLISVEGTFPNIDDRWDWCCRKGFCQ